jgi:hypothetical protein
MEGVRSSIFKNTKKESSMKKILICVLLFALLFSGAVFAKDFAVGLAVTFSMSTLNQAGNPGVIGLLKLPSLPVMLGFGGTIGSNATNFYVKADWWLAQGRLSGMIQYYAGLGVYTIISEQFEIGGRIPVGLQIFPLDFLEVFLEPSLTVGVGGIGGNAIDFPVIGFIGELGVRFWF